jgi:glyoxylase-like metal-dependent hydrolase (beta-lactamase superfamily II)
MTRGLNDAVAWSADLGGGTEVGLLQAGSFLTDAGVLMGPVPKILWANLVADELRDDNRVVQALNCLVVETPAGRVLVETGIGDRVTDKLRAARGYEGPWIGAELERVGIEPGSIDRVALSHLHYDHAGGLLRADGSRLFPRATIVAQRAEWEVALSDNLRIAASYDQPELELVHDWGAEGWVDGEREILPGVSVVPTGGHTGGHQAVVVRGAGSGGRTLAFFGDLAIRAWSGNPRWVTAFDDFPLDSVTVKAALFARAADEGWLVVLSHESRRPVGHLVRDRDRFRYEAV